MNDVVYRLANIDDAHGIVDVHVKTWQKAYHGIVPQQYLDGMDAERNERIEKWKGTISNPPNARIIMVAAIGERIIGFSAFGPLRDTSEEDKNIGEIYALYILPEYAGQGHGQIFMDIAKQNFIKKGINRLCVEVLEDNTKAFSFYEKAAGCLELKKEKETEIGGKSFTLKQYYWDAKGA